MILPIYVYGEPVLRKVSEEIEADYEGLEGLINDMYETMYQSDGVGLAAPQVGKSLRLFVIDTTALADKNPELKGFKKVFINPEILEESGDEWTFNEGCLSVPAIREDIARKSKIRISYYDENFNYFEEDYDGIKARVMQHEYDHLEGILFPDRLSPFKKRLLKNKLAGIAKGLFEVNYKVKPPLKQKVKL